VELANYETREHDVFCSNFTLTKTYENLMETAWDPMEFHGDCMEFH